MTRARLHNVVNLSASAAAPAYQLVDPHAKPATLANVTSNVVSVEGLQFGHVYHLTERLTNSSGVTAEQSIVLRAGPT